MLGKMFHLIPFPVSKQSLKFVDFTKTQKFRYLEDETLFFLQIKKG